MRGAIHSDLKEMADKQLAAIWLPKEIDMARDIHNLEALSAPEQHFLETILSFLPLVMVWLLKIWLVDFCLRQHYRKLNIFMPAR